jgi:hypothetical protein
MRCLGSFAILCLFAASASSVADPIEEKLVDEAQLAVIQLKVVGKMGSTNHTEDGVGFLFKTKSKPRILTAKHVVEGARIGWDLNSAGAPDRRIYFTVFTPNFGALEIQKPSDQARDHPELDVSQIYVEFRGSGNPLVLSSRVPKIGDDLWVMSWPKKEDNVQPRHTTVGNTAASDKPLVRPVAAAIFS